MNVKELHFTRLTLVQPLRYRRDDSLNPFDGSVEKLPEGGWEILFSMILDSARGQDFSAEGGGRYFAALLNAGKTRFGDAVEAGDPAGRPDSAAPEAAGETVDLPAGVYFFTQAREFLGREELTEMALELQKEGLWQRLEMDNRIFIRYLYEDGSAVTQLFRPVSGGGEEPRA
jgi:hypothetical protein